MVFTYKIQIQEGKCSQFQYGDCRACTGPSMSVSLVPETVDQPSLCVQGTCTTWEAVLGGAAIAESEGLGYSCTQGRCLTLQTGPEGKKGVPESCPSLILSLFGEILRASKINIPPPGAALRDNSARSSGTGPGLSPLQTALKGSRASQHAEASWSHLSPPSSRETQAPSL